MWILFYPRSYPLMIGACVLLPFASFSRARTFCVMFTVTYVTNNHNNRPPLPHRTPSASEELIHQKMQTHRTEPSSTNREP
uniref:Putative secreted protein n=1 Tax=Anopheles darlingi TaxID=43151 RepID=A0A2M4DKI3_ANODA